MNQDNFQAVQAYQKEKLKGKNKVSTTVHTDTKTVIDNGFTETTVTKTITDHYSDGTSSTRKEIQITKDEEVPQGPGGTQQGSGGPVPSKSQTTTYSTLSQSTYGMYGPPSNSTNNQVQNQKNGQQGQGQNAPINNTKGSQQPEPSRKGGSGPDPRQNQQQQNQNQGQGQTRPGQGQQGQNQYGQSQGQSRPGQGQQGQNQYGQSQVQGRPGQSPQGQGQQGRGQQGPGQQGQNQYGQGQQGQNQQAQGQQPRRAGQDIHTHNTTGYMIDPASPRAELKTGDDFIQAALDCHNKYRAKHGADNLVLSKDLCKIAQSFANHLLQLGTMENSHYGYGENIYWTSGPGQALRGDVPVEYWYNEVNHFDWSNMDFQKTTGSFTQVIWKETKQFGIAKAFGPTGTFIVAFYVPPGNVIGHFPENIQSANTED